MNCNCAILSNNKNTQKGLMNNASYVINIIEEKEIQMKTDINTQKRKQNMKIYSIYRGLSMDLLFIYAIDFLFLTQIKRHKRIRRSFKIIILRFVYDFFTITSQHTN